ncbi:hypothetical protein BKP64_17890 [Marinobacter salinus]|uniref:Uncharacterized protein n=1 Tax=Marinobacter salinus TaxID=1874317 RepID=A0A1D9GQR4_9GAMM|nr:hypothetical protein [Marinobacter salinus]AOY89884.1 hypothetical protein BKP64_17890 [Marinobacter salinus]
MKVFKFGSLALAVALSACGGDSGSSSSSALTDDTTTLEDTKTGVFTDSAVANIRYQTMTQSGFTNALGEYEYAEGETVTFSIGGIELPPVAATGRVTPADMTAEASSTDQLTNILRLLQSLDEDGNPDNGITITGETHTALENALVVVDQPATAFEAQFSDEVAISVNKTLISAGEAEAHFYASQQADLHGSWIFVEPSGESSNGQGPNGEEINVLTFLDGGIYILAHKYGNLDQGPATAEWGTYTWDPATGALVIEVLGESEGGEGGLCPGLAADVGNCTESVQLVGDELHFASEAGAATPFQSIKDASNSYVGAWYLPEGEGFNVLTILDDSHYVIAHNMNGEVYAGTDLVAVSSEWGTYSLTNGSFEVTGVETETDGPGGLYDAGGTGGLTATSTVTGYGDLQLEPAGDTMFALRRVGRFSVELTDLAGNTSSILVERSGDLFAGGVGKAFEFDLVGEADAAQVTLQSDGTGSVTYSDGLSLIDAWSVNAGGAISYTETNVGDSSTGHWVFAPIKSDDGKEWALVDFRHVDGTTESLLGFYVSELRPL